MTGGRGDGLQAFSRGPKRRQGLLDLGKGDPFQDPESGGRQGVLDLVGSQERERDVDVLSGGGQGELDSLQPQGFNVCRPNLGGFPGSIGEGRPFGLEGDFPDVGVVPIDAAKGLFGRSPEEGALFDTDTLEGLEAFQVNRGDVRDQGAVGPDDPGEEGDFAGDIRSEFDDGHVRVRFDRQERLGNTHAVVFVFPGLGNLVFARQDGGGHFLRGCLPHGPGDGTESRSQALSIGTREGPVGVKGVRDKQAGDFALDGNGVLGEDGPGPPGKRGPNELVTVMRGPL